MTDDERRLRPPSVHDVREVDGAPVSDAIARDGHALELSEEMQPSTRISWPMLVLRFGAPALAALALVMVLAGDSQDIDHDLRLIAPHAIVAGGSLPVRALLYANLHGIEGPKLVAQPVSLELRIGDRVLAQGTLNAARTAPHDLEGELSVPRDLHGAAKLIARTRIDGNELTSSVPLHVNASPGAEAERTVGRALRALQQFAEGPIRAELGMVAPSALRARIAGGACVPEQRCTIYVHVGDPAAALSVEANSAVTPAPSSAKASAETREIVKLELTTHGPEAELWLHATRAGVLVARRSIRLPIAMASDALRVTKPIVVAGTPLELALGSEARGCIIDDFNVGHDARGSWSHTASLSRCDNARLAGLPLTAAGLQRLQLRRDAFSASTAGVSVVYLRAPEESEQDVLGVLAKAALAADGGDAFVHDVVERPATHLADFDLTSRYLLAILEDGLFELPAAESGYPESVAKLRVTQSRLRVLALCSLGFGALALALTVGQRGLSAASRASEILIDAGQDAQVSRRRRVRSLVAILASVLALVLVFIVVALYVIARGVSFG